MTPLLVLFVLLQGPNGTDNAELTGVVDSYLTPEKPATPAFCVRATAAEAALLPQGAARGRIWSCTLSCHLPSEERKALFIERRGREPVVFVDMDRDSQFSTDEVYEFPRRGDLLIRVPVSRGALAEFPVLLQHRWPLFKSRGYPERRLLLQSITAHFAGRVIVGGRSLAVRYPLNWDDGTPAVSTGWIRIDADGDGRIDEDPLSVESIPPRADPTVLRVGNRYLSTVSIDPATREVTLREHPAADYRRIEIREGDRLPDFDYTDGSGTTHRLSDVRTPLVLVVVWSPWCPPALTQLLHIEHAYRRLGSESLTVLGLPHETDLEKTKPVIDNFRLTWPSADPESVRDLLRNQLWVASVPLLIVLDGDRHVLKVNRPGDLALYATNLRKTLRTLLRARKSASYSARSASIGSTRTARRPGM